MKGKIHYKRTFYLPVLGNVPVNFVVSGILTIVWNSSLSDNSTSKYVAFTYVLFENIWLFVKSAFAVAVTFVPSFLNPLITGFSNTSLNSSTYSPSAKPKDSLSNLISLFTVVLYVPIVFQLVLLFVIYSTL